MISFTTFFDNLRDGLYSRARLGKFLLCLLIGSSTVFGYILAKPSPSIKMVVVGFGVFILAAGAATINSLQEYRLDGQMERTRYRPLPQGLVSPFQAGLQGGILVAAGLVTIYFAAGWAVPVGVAASAVILYNGIYTPLKQKNVLAIVPGAICGALPPYIGWLAGGGAAVSYSAALLAALFVLWQIPHFWLVVLSFQHDYAISTLPNFLRQFGKGRLNRFFVTWIGSMAMVMLMFITFPLDLVFRIAVCANTVLMLLIISYGLAVRRPRSYRLVFIFLNVSLFFHMLIVAVGRCVA